MKFLKGVALSLMAALAAAEEDFTVTVTNYVTAPCFANAIKSVDNGKAAALGIPVVLVWGEASTAVAQTSTKGSYALSAATALAAKEEDVTYTVTDYTTDFGTTYVPCTVTDYVTSKKTITTCVENICNEVVTTTLCPTTYATSVKSIYAVSSKAITTESISTKTYSTGQNTETASTSGAAASEETDTAGLHNCSKCKVLTLVLSYKFTTSVIFSATSTPSPTFVAPSYTPVSQTASNPVFKELPVTTGSVISASNSFDVSSLFQSSSSSGSVLLSPSNVGPAATGAATGGAAGNSNVGPAGTAAGTAAGSATGTGAATGGVANGSGSAAGSASGAATSSIAGGATGGSTAGGSSSTGTPAGTAAGTAKGGSTGSAAGSSSGAPASLSISLYGFHNTSLALSMPSSVGSSSLSGLISSLVASSSSLTSGSAVSSSVGSGSSSSSVSSLSSLIFSSASSSSSASSASSSSSSSLEATLTIQTVPTCHTVPDLFSVISSENPAQYFPTGQVPVTIPNGVSNTLPYETNKFYGNLFLGNQDNMAWTYPYGVFWDRTTHFGLSVLHTDVSKRTFGPTNSNGAASYYYNAPRVGELVFSANTFHADASMQLTDMTEFSAKVTISDGLSDPSSIEFPLVKGMGFVTAIYHGSMIVRISSDFAVTTLTKETTLLDSLVLYRATLNSGTQWLLYVTKPVFPNNFQLNLVNNVIYGSGYLDGVIIQAAVAPAVKDQEAFYLAAAGKYVTSAKVTGSLACTAAKYSFDYTTAGSSLSDLPLLFALPHHLEALDSITLQSATGISLDSTTKGKMYAFLTSSLSFAETINPDIQFLPWRQDFGTTIKYGESQLQAIHAAARSELNGVDVAATIALLGSMYYMGKLVDKYAYILLVLHDVVHDIQLTRDLLAALKTFFATLSLNNINYPLMYDTRFGGVTSTANNNGDTSAEFGAGYYNDHHFHYGYHIHAAAIVGYIDKQLGGTWAKDNKGWVNALIRDVANPSTSDPYFPVSRMFDWYHGHSYAKGLFESADGKDEESSSEDYNFSYGMKLWGNVIGDTAMEARGDLMLKIQSRSMNLYFLYSNDNDVEPSNFIANKVSGIYFDNKIDHTTYFGTNTEYIHGVHMLPITPASSLIRGSTFVSQEWSSIISGIIGSVNSGWTGILRLNQALFDGSSSYNFFSSSSFSNNYLDGGQSLTWSLAYSAAIANGA